MNRLRTVISVAVALLIIGFTFANLPIAQATGLALDGTGNCSNGNSNTCTGTLTTIGSSDVIIVAEGTGNGHNALTPSDTAGLVWISRNNVESSGDALDEHIYYAITITPLSSDVITCKFDNNARSDCLFFGVSGAYTSAPFDITSGLPCSTSGTSTSPSCMLSTTSSPDMILGFTSTGCDIALTADTGFTLIHANNVCAPSMGAEYQLVSSTQTNLVVGMTLGASVGWVISADAIVAAASMTSSSSSSSSQTTSSTTSSSSSSTTSSTTSSSSSSTTSTSTSSTCPLGLPCTSTTSTTSTSTTSTITAPTYTPYFTGVTFSDAGMVGNSGVRVTLQAVPQTTLVGGNYMAAWIDDTLPNNFWLQVGYIQINDSGTVYAVEQVWNLTSGILLGDAVGPTVPVGSYNVFEAQAISSTSWGFFFDGVQFGSYNFGANFVSTSAQSGVLLEQQTLGPTPFSFNTINAQSMQYLSGGNWHYIVSATSYTYSVWQVQGKAQSSTFANDEFSVSQGTALSPGTTIWNGVG